MKKQGKCFFGFFESVTVQNGNYIRRQSVRDFMK